MLFEKGKSGNPGGRPRRPPEEIAKWVEAAKGNLPILLDIRDNAERESDRLKAIEMIEDRAYGKPLQAVELTGDEGGPVESLVKVELVKPSNS